MKYLTVGGDENDNILLENWIIKSITKDKYLEKFSGKSKDEIQERITKGWKAGGSTIPYLEE